MKKLMNYVYKFFLDKTFKMGICATLFIPFYSGYSQDLKIPQTPAFSILNYEPSSVMRPSSIKKLSSDILNSFDSNGKLIMNLGVEVSPYWLKNRPELSREEFLNPKPIQNVWQTFSISAATVKDTITGKNNLGLGFRTQIVRGKLSSEFVKYDLQLKKTEEAKAFIAAAKSFVGSTLTSRDAIIAFLESNLAGENSNEEIKKMILSKAKDLKNKFTDEPSSLHLYCEAIINQLEEKTNQLANKVINLEAKRYGFSLEMAGAAKFVSTNESSQSFNKLGIWINANNFFSLTDAWTVTARHLIQVNQDNNASNTDLGFGYLKTGNNFNASVEGMLRWYRQEIPDFNQSGDNIIRLEKDFTYRLAGQISYQLFENISANFSFGKDFNEPKLKSKSFFSIFGLHYALFNKREELYKIEN